MRHLMSPLDFSVEELEQLMSADTTGMIVVLIDNPRQMEIGRASCRERV